MTLKINPESANNFEWRSIIAGTILALAITLVLLQFGEVIGLSAALPFGDNTNIAPWGLIAIAIWLLWIQLLSSITGGYIAGRLRNPSAALIDYENEFHDGINGLMVWALSTVLIFIAIGIAASIAGFMAIANDTYQVNEDLTNNEKNKMVIFAFSAAATSIVSAIAAWWSAVLGGDHRDQKTDLRTIISFRKY